MSISCDPTKLNMETQFKTKYTIPYETDEYVCFRQDKIKSILFNLLMKWSLMCKEHPDLLVNIEELLKEKSGSNYINYKNKEGWTALMLAVANSNYVSSYECVELLVKYGANINIINDHNRDALYYSIYSFSSDERCTKLLIQNNANTNIIYKCDYKNKNKDNTIILTYLLYNYNYNCNKRKLELLLENCSADIINLSNSNGMTPLLIASSKTYTNKYGWNVFCMDSIKLLLQYKADINYNKYNNETKLDEIINDRQYNSPFDDSLCKLFIDNGAKLKNTKLSQIRDQHIKDYFIDHCKYNKSSTHINENIEENKIGEINIESDESSSTIINIESDESSSTSNNIFNSFYDKYISKYFPNSGYKKLEQ